VDHELRLECADVTAKKFKQSCQFHTLVIDETTIIVLLDSWATATGSKPNVYLKDF
jgi:hypothetical protein